MHIISLIVTYLAIIIAFFYIMRLRKVASCTTTRREDSPLKTEPSPTGPIPTTSRYNRELQDDTEFRSRAMPQRKPVSGFYSER